MIIEGNRSFLILDLILEVPRPRQLHEIHSSTLGSAGDFNLSHLSSLSSHVAKVGKQRSFPLLRGVLPSTVTFYNLAAPHGRNSPRIVRPLGSGVNPNLE